MTILEKFFRTVNKLGPFEKHSNLAVAVSGGSDSLALTILLHKWAVKNGANLFALTVDHLLRSESTQETTELNATLKEQGINHRIITLQAGTIAESNTQEIARDLRYKELCKFCKQNNIFHLFTGHTLDDDVENYFIRLARGTSLLGLTGIKQKSIRDNVRLLRPLLTFTKKELQIFLKENNTTWIEDPSNHNDRFTRVIARNLVNSNEMIRLSNQKDPQIFFRRVANIINETNGVYQNERTGVLNYLLNNATIHPEGIAELNLLSIQECAPSIFIRALSMLITTISPGIEHQPRYESLSKIYKNLIRGDFTNSTLGKCYIKIKPSRNLLKISPETIFNQKEKNIPFEKNQDYNLDPIKFFPKAGLAENTFDD